MPEETGTPTPTQEEAPKAYTQDEINRIIVERLNRERKKYDEQFADYEALKADAQAYRELQEAQKSELEKAQDRIAQLESEKAAREQAEAHEKLVRQIMADHKVDPEYMPLLTGATEAELNKQAELIGRRFSEPSLNERTAPANVNVPDVELREFARRFLHSNDEN